mgnify:CR=1 FL=1
MARICLESRIFNKWFNVMLITLVIALVGFGLGMACRAVYRLGQDASKNDKK